MPRASRYSAARPRVSPQETARDRDISASPSHSPPARPFDQDAGALGSEGELRAAPAALAARGHGDSSATRHPSRHPVSIADAASPGRTHPRSPPMLQSATAARALAATLAEARTPYLTSDGAAGSTPPRSIMQYTHAQSAAEAASQGSQLERASSALFPRGYSLDSRERDRVNSSEDADQARREALSSRISHVLRMLPSSDTDDQEAEDAQNESFSDQVHRHATLASSRPVNDAAHWRTLLAQHARRESSSHGSTSSDDGSLGDGGHDSSSSSSGIGLSSIQAAFGLEPSSRAGSHAPAVEHDMSPLGHELAARAQRLRQALGELEAGELSSATSDDGSDVDHAAGDASAISMDRGAPLHVARRGFNAPGSEHEACWGRGPSQAWNRAHSPPTHSWRPQSMIEQRPGGGASNVGDSPPNAHRTAHATPSDLSVPRLSHRVLEASLIDSQASPRLSRGHRASAGDIRLPSSTAVLAHPGRAPIRRGTTAPDGLVARARAAPFGGDSGIATPAGMGHSRAAWRAGRMRTHNGGSAVGDELDLGIASATRAVGNPDPTSRLREPRARKHEDHDQAAVDKETVSASAVEELLPSLRCFICFNALDRAVMCPSCSTMACESCLTRWITDAKPECPHCRAHLFLSQLVPCRFIDDLQAQLRSLKLSHSLSVETDGENSSTKHSSSLTLAASGKNGPGDDTCEQHGAPVYYYCTTCAVPLCSDCAMFSGDHRGHEFVHLDAVYQEHVDRIRDSRRKVETRVTEHLEAASKIDERLSALEDTRRQVQEEITSIVQNAADSLDRQLQTHADRLLGIKSALEEHVDGTRSNLYSVAQKVSALPRASLLRESRSILDKLEALETTTLPEAAKIDSVNVGTLENPLMPQFVTTDVHIRDFGAYASTGQVFFSPPLQSGGVMWRLKVYPRGNAQARGDHLSVFVEAMDMARGAAVEYTYRLEMVSHGPSEALGVLGRDPDPAPLSPPTRAVDPLSPQTPIASSPPSAVHSPQSQLRPAGAASGPSIIREFTSRFSRGECWGYNRFYALDRLQRDGFLTPTGSLHLRLHVRPLEYSQRVADLGRYAARLERENSELKTRLAMAEARAAGTPPPAQDRSPSSVSGSSGKFSSGSPVNSKLPKDSPTLPSENMAPTPPAAVESLDQSLSRPPVSTVADPPLPSGAVSEPPALPSSGSDIVSPLPGAYFRSQ